MICPEIESEPKHPRHREYSLRPSDMAKDAEYAVSTALQVVADLIQGRGRGRAHA